MNAVVTTSPLMDAALDAVFQALVVGITGLPGTLVRPRWQPVPPTQPSVTTNWAAIGVTTNAADAGLRSSMTAPAQAPTSTSATRRSRSS